jgi:hypothetical protein
MKYFSQLTDLKRYPRIALNCLGKDAPISAQRKYGYKGCLSKLAQTEVRMAELKYSLPTGEYGQSLESS